LTLASNGETLTGLWLKEQRYFAAGLEPDAKDMPGLPVFRETAAWLERYFSGQRPPDLPSLAPHGSRFRQAIWKKLLEIPYGQTRSYGELAEALGSSPRAVGGAVGHNPISILIPCHRVVGAHGSLTGYAGGVEKKRFLLKLERDSLARREEALPTPSLTDSPQPERVGKKPGRFPCPCCGCKTFPVPKEDALAYICPVCFWENDVFDLNEDQPSDENHGMTLRQARESYRRLGAVRKDLLPYVRSPLPEELA